ARLVHDAYTTLARIQNNANRTLERILHGGPGAAPAAPPGDAAPPADAPAPADAAPADATPAAPQ
ncbi:MAG: hypothetical protein ACKPJJ_14800, partial [Planctomycetaceae bacterium]